MIERGEIHVAFERGLKLTQRARFFFYKRAVRERERVTSCMLECWCEKYEQTLFENDETHATKKRMKKEKIISKTKQNKKTIKISEKLRKSICKHKKKDKRKIKKSTKYTKNGLKNILS